MKFLMFLFLFYFSTSTSVQGADIIEETCKKTEYYDLCVKTLRSDPRSSNADLKGLTQITLEASLVFGRGAFIKIKKMYNETKDKGLKSCLHVCVENYELAVVINLPGAIKLLGRNKFNDVNSYLSAAYDAPETCLDSFSEEPKTDVPPALAAWNDHFEQLCTIALDMLSNLGN
ncbi:hypothetical protein MANES_10G035400v8 [Manihot esculenta]|uniref:Pectinesterase inhibitor domain-containing protein n=1 Tax=Manihot esculenta TaxID=3983 RepID=A0A2C9V319_MANES|nr:hypothetical protein MANES_10G035400v8 [Manihot esculenta]